MLKKTKITLAVLGLSISSATMAGMYAAPPAPTCTPGDVTVPCADVMWDIGAQALYFQAIYDGNAAYSNAINNPFYYNDLDNEWGWGYRIVGSVHFNTGNDITMNWTHYDHDADQNNLESVFLPIAPIQPLAEYYMDWNNTFDKVNLVLGQHVDMGLLKNTRFYGGLQYMRIRAETSSQFTNFPFNNFRRTTFSDSKGAGPVVGIDYSYDLWNGFSVTANAETSIIYGNGRYSSSFISAPTNLVFNNAYATKKVIVPSLDARLGVNYAYVAPMGTLNIEAGYEALNYFNALQTRGASALGRLTDTDFGLYGPYVGLHWIGDVGIPAAPEK